MNTERILELADKIEKADPVAFDMSSWSAQLEPVSCQSPGCIAGWAVTVFDPDWSGWKMPFAERHSTFGPIVTIRAAELLELDLSTADELFRMSNAARDYHRVRPDGAARVLRRLAATGEVNWHLIY